MPTEIFHVGCEDHFCRMVILDINTERVILTNTNTQTMSSQETSYSLEEFAMLCEWVKDKVNSAVEDLKERKADLEESVVLEKNKATS